MNERPRHRDVLGTTTSRCPHCGRGPMIITRSYYVRRLRDAANPWFDADVAIRHACTACSARFPISEERMRIMLAESSTTAVGDDEDSDQFLDHVAARAEAAEQVAAAERARRQAEEDRARAEEAARVEGEAVEVARAEAAKRAETEAHGRCRAEDRARAEAEARRRAAEQARTGPGAGAGAEADAQVEVVAPTPARATGMWGTADIAGPAPEGTPTRIPTTGRVLVGRPTEVGAGRRSGPARPPAGDHAR